MIREFELLDEDFFGNQLIKLTSKKYSGIIYTYGQVKLIEEDDVLRVQFNYDIHENPIGELDRNDFKDYVGSILIDILDEQLNKNQVVYTGGIDENRTTDSEQSDSQ